MIENKRKSYQDLEVYKISFKLALIVHSMSMKLPKFELYEEGSQIRRSSKSIASNIVEGFGRKKYKAEFVRYLIFAHSSCDETIFHLEMIKECHDKAEELNMLIKDYFSLSKMLNKFIQYVELHWKNEMPSS